MLVKETSFSPILSLVSEGEASSNLSKLESLGLKINFPYNRVIIQFGEHVHGLYLLTKGKVTASFMSPQGSKIVVFMMKPICIFGEIPFFNQSKSNLEIEVFSQSSLIYFDKNTSNHLLDNNSFFKELIIKSAMTKAQISVSHLSDIYNLSPEQRVCKYLEYLCTNYQQNSSENRYTIYVTQEEMGFLVGLSRVTIARIYSNLRDYNILDNSLKSKKIEYN